MHVSHPLTLEQLATGVRASVVAIPAEDVDRLAAEGLHVGDTIEVEGRLPLGGPVIVRLGRARVALSRTVAAGIAVAPMRPA